MTTIKCGNPDTTFEHSHASVLDVKVCFARTASLNADDPQEFRRYLGEQDYARYLEETFESPWV